eukprot:4669245-Prymnesium_polylepis.1
MAAVVAMQRSLPAFDLRSRLKYSLGDKELPYTCSLQLDGRTIGWVLVLGESEERFSLLMRMFHEATKDMSVTLHNPGWFGHAVDDATSASFRSMLTLKEYARCFRAAEAEGPNIYMFTRAVLTEGEWVADLSCNEPGENTYFTENGHANGNS